MSSDDWHFKWVCKIPLKMLKNPDKTDFHIEIFLNLTIFHHLHDMILLMENLQQFQEHVLGLQPLTAQTIIYIKMN